MYLRTKAEDDAAVSYSSELPNFKIDFRDYSFIPVTGQSASNDITVSTDGNSLILNGNTWAVIQLPDPITVTASNRVNFSYQAPSEGEIHGFCLLDREPNQYSPISEIFAEGVSFGGTQRDLPNFNFALDDNYPFNNSLIRYSYNLTQLAPLGRVITYLLFLNDDDEGIGSGSTFHNVRFIL